MDTTWTFSSMTIIDYIRHDRCHSPKHAQKWFSWSDTLKSPIFPSMGNSKGKFQSKCRRSLQCLLFSCLYLVMPLFHISVQGGKPSKLLTLVLSYKESFGCWNHKPHKFSWLWRFLSLILMLHCNESQEVFHSIRNARRYSDGCFEKGFVGHGSLMYDAHLKCIKHQWIPLKPIFHVVRNHLWLI